jgi:plastocyanin
VKLSLPVVLPAVLLAALLAACGGQSDSEPEPGTGTGTAEGPADAQTFTIHGTDADTFDPATVQAKVGELTLSLSNGGVPHNLMFDDKAFKGIPVVNGSGTKSTVLTFDRPGTYTFECTLHPGMSGRVVVG